jgi:hypothetical protein
MYKEVTSVMTRLITAVIFTSLLISCEKISQNQPSTEQPYQNQLESQL